VVVVVDLKLTLYLLVLLATLYLPTNLDLWLSSSDRPSSLSSPLQSLLVTEQSDGPTGSPPLPWSDSGPLTGPSSQLYLHLERRRCLSGFDWYSWTWFITPGTTSTSHRIVPNRPRTGSIPIHLSWSDPTTFGSMACHITQLTTRPRTWTRCTRQYLPLPLHRPRDRLIFMRFAWRGTSTFTSLSFSSPTSQLRLLFCLRVRGDVYRC
jgi:hypothetical protein